MILAHAPEPIQEFLPSQAADLGNDWQGLSRALQAYITRHQTYDNQGHPAPAPRGVPAPEALLLDVVANSEGKGKGH